VLHCCCLLDLPAHAASASQPQERGATPIGLVKFHCPVFDQSRSSLSSDQGSSGSHSLSPMGPPVGSQASVSSILDLVPSPTDSVNDVFDSSTRAYASAPLQSPDGLRPASRLDDASELPPEPDLVKPRPVTTPPAEDQSCTNINNMNLIVGGALAPIPSCPSMDRPSIKSSPLRL
jgi:hypothetical protein